MAASGTSGGEKKPPSPPGSAPPRHPVPRIVLNDLLAGGREAVLVHNGAEYHLRLTSNDKLIMTK